MSDIWDLRQHSYEEIREIVVDVFLKPGGEPDQWLILLRDVSQQVAIKDDRPHAWQYNPQLHPYDLELVRDVFWDLFRQGFITLGKDDNNPQWPHFRLSHFGKRTLAAQSPYRFHDTDSFLNLVKNEVPDISSESVIYLEEAVAAFYAGCLLASCVMLGVAAEAEFLRLADVASAHQNHGAKFAAVAKCYTVRQKINKFHDALKPLIPGLGYSATEDLDTNFLAIQSVLRIARNDAGHPTGAKLSREQVYVYLQLFTPFARQLMRLRSEFK